MLNYTGKLSKLAVACVRWKHQALSTFAAATSQGKEFWVLLLPSLTLLYVQKYPLWEYSHLQAHRSWPLWHFLSNFNSSRSSCLYSFAPGLDSPYLVTDYLWGWPPPRSPYPRIYRCSVLKNATRPDIRKIVTGYKHSRQQNPLRKSHGNALVQTSATRGHHHHHPHTPGRRD